MSAITTMPAVGSPLAIVADMASVAIANRGFSPTTDYAVGLDEAGDLRIPSPMGTCHMVVTDVANQGRVFIVRVFRYDEGTEVAVLVLSGDSAIGLIGHLLGDLVDGEGVFES